MVIIKVQIKSEKNAELLALTVKEPRLIRAWLYCFQLVVLQRGFGMGLHEVKGVADQIVSS